MNDVRALAYADWRALVNDVRGGLRSPGRIAVWCLYGIALAFFIASRSLRSARAGGHAAGDLQRADYFVCAALVSVALAAATGGGLVGIFRSRAEARFIIGSPVSAPLAIAYLQARESVGRSLRLVVSLTYAVFLFGPRRIGPFGLAADMLLMIALLTAGAAITVPRRLLPRPWSVVCAIVAVPLAVLAAVPALRDLAIVLPLPPLVAFAVARRVPALHPGIVLLEPNAIWLLAALALTAVAVALLAAGGRDAYPELYALSLARIDRAARFAERRARVTRAAASRPAVAVTLPAPSGVLVYVWKSVVEFRRAHANGRLLAAGIAVWLAGGFGLGRLGANDDGLLFAVLINGALAVLFLVGVNATNAIGGEVRRPLFWLSPAPLFERLCALAAARVWRAVFSIELVTAGFAAGGGTLFDCVVLGIALPALVGLLAGVGFAAYALVPSVADARGPLTALRLGFSLLLVLPPLVLGVLAALFGARVLGVLAFTLLTLIEAGLLIGVAAWRIDGRIDRFAA